MKLKVFRKVYEHEIEKEVNDFCSDVNVVNIQMLRENGYYVACITYTLIEHSTTL